MRVSAKTDYGLRALVALAARAPDVVKLDSLVAEQGLPLRFVESILGELRRAGFVHSRRGADGGYRLALPPAGISVGAVIRVLDGPLAEAPRTHLGPKAVALGDRPAGAGREGADHVAELWGAMAASVCDVLDSTTLEHLVSGQFPEHVRRLAECARGWTSSGVGG